MNTRWFVAKRHVPTHCPTCGLKRWDLQTFYTLADALRGALVGYTCILDKHHHSWGIHSWRVHCTHCSITENIVSPSPMWDYVVENQQRFKHHSVQFPFRILHEKT